jgi:hypothetical protein
MKKPTTHTPTRRAYTGLDAAFDHFNRELFGGELPPCLITMQRQARAYGYFSGNRFAVLARPDEITDEIALNPQYFEADKVDIALSTLAHEMCHLWQHHFGKRPSRCYHDKQWAAKMVEIGLIPSDTGKPGGKQTGQKVGDYIEEGGRFARSAAAFLARGDFVLFKDRASLQAQGGSAGTSGTEEGEGEQDGGKKKSPGRIKFTCPSCDLNAWAKPAAKLVCGECDEALTPV